MNCHLLRVPELMSPSAAAGVAEESERAATTRLMMNDASWRRLARDARLLPTRSMVVKLSVGGCRL